MKEFNLKIYWDDLTPMAQERLRDLYPENEDMPLAVIPKEYKEV